MIKSPRGGGKKGKGKGVEVEEHPHHDKKTKNKKGDQTKESEIGNHTRGRGLRLMMRCV